MSLFIAFSNKKVCNFNCGEYFAVKNLSETLYILTRIGAQCYEYTGRSDALFLFVYRAPKEDSHFQTQLANTLNHSICHKLQYKLD